MIEKEIRRDVLREIDRYEEELIKHIQEIVKIPSTSPNYPGLDRGELLGGETKVNEYLEPIMADLGLETDLWEVEEKRANLVGVQRGSGEGKSLILNGHVDTVPPGQEDLWTIAGPYSGKVIDGKIYGRGTTDMKASLVAAIAAVRGLIRAGYHLKGDVIIESVVGEEMMDTKAGTGATIARGYKADAGIVMEPSSPPYRLAILTASPGVLSMKVTIQGKPAHTCMRDELIRAGGKGSEVAVSAVDKAFIIYKALLALEDEWGQTKSHPAFTRPGHFTLCPASFMGGFNGIGYIPEEAYIEYVIWTAPQDTRDEVKKEVEDQIARFAETDPWLREHPPIVEWTWWWPPYDVPKDTPICKAAEIGYEAALGEPAKYYGFAAVDDAVFLNQAGIPTISMGPGSIQVAHAANEYIEIDEVLDAAKIYAMTIVEWCGVE